jgi:hypothetical protein
LYDRKVSRFFQVIIAGGLERKVRDVDAEQDLTPNGSILMKLDRFRRALAHTGPALNTILRVDRIGFVSFDFIDFAWADLGTIPAAIAFFLIDDRIHTSNKKSKTLILGEASVSDQSETKMLNSKLEILNSKQTQNRKF